MKPTILVSTDKGDNFKIEGVIGIMSATYENAIIIESVVGIDVAFDKILRDRSIELVNVEVEDVGF